MICMKSAYWRRNAWMPDSFLPSASLLRPWEVSREAASVADRPCAGSTPRLRATSDPSIEYGSGVEADPAVAPIVGLSVVISIDPLYPGDVVRCTQPGDRACSTLPAPC